MTGYTLQYSDEKSSELIRTHQTADEGWLLTDAYDVLGRGRLLTETQRALGLFPRASPDVIHAAHAWFRFCCGFPVCGCCAVLFLATIE